LGTGLKRRVVIMANRSSLQLRWGAHLGSADVCSMIERDLVPGYVPNQHAQTFGTNKREGRPMVR